MRTVGGQSEAGRLVAVAVKPVRDAFHSDDALERHWRDLGYGARPVFSAAVAEYARFVALLDAAAVEMLCLPAHETDGLDSLYARDAAIVCDAGVILCNMTKAQRKREPRAHEEAYRAAGIPIHGRIEGDSRLEGGNMCCIELQSISVVRVYHTLAPYILQSNAFPI